LFPEAKTDFGQYMGATLARATIGGVASVAGGGKFANGALTRAYQYLATNKFEGSAEERFRNANNEAGSYFQRGYFTREQQLAADLHGDVECIGRGGPGCGGIQFLPGPMVIEGAAAREFSLLLGNGKGILATLSESGIVQMAIEAGIDSSLSGTQLFSRMMNYFGDSVKGINGYWAYGTNLAKVNQLTAAGMLLGEAVTQTWTASRAATWGFGNATVRGFEGGGLAPTGTWMFSSRDSANES
jgi:hypothetical protein